MDVSAFVQLLTTTPLPYYSSFHPTPFLSQQLVAWIPPAPHITSSNRVKLPFPLQTCAVSTGMFISRLDECICFSPFPSLPPLPPLQVRQAILEERQLVRCVIFNRFVEQHTLGKERDVNVLMKYYLCYAHGYHLIYTN